MAEAVLLIAFGGPAAPDEIRPFLDQLLRGRRVPPGRVEEVVHHYELIGGRSPLNEITFRQADALRRLLEREGPPVPVFVGMRAWDPYIADALREMTAAGIDRAAGLVLAPHRSEASWDRYTKAIDDACATIGPGSPHMEYAGPWHDHPLFIEALAGSIAAAYGGIPAERRSRTRLVFTAHSVPVAMSDASGYAAQVVETARRTAARLGRRDWVLAYQSRSGNPRDPWLGPGISEVLKELAEAGETDVVVAPAGFVTDHVEVLYDLDIEARAIAGGAGLRFTRAPTVADNPIFIRLLAELARATLGRRPSTPGSSREPSMGTPSSDDKNNKQEQ